MSTTSSQFLSVPQLNHRSHRLREHRYDRGRSATLPVPHASSPSRADPPEHVASSSRVRLEDSPLGSQALKPKSSPAAASAPVHTHTPSAAHPQATPAADAGSGSPPAHATPRDSVSSLATPQTSPRSLFRTVPFLMRLRSPPASLLSVSCSSGAPRTHAVLRQCAQTRAPHALAHTKRFVCADAVNAEMLLRFTRNELLLRAQRVNRAVTALVDEEWSYTIQQTKGGDYHVQVSYSACPAQCENADPRKPVALNHATNIPGLMRIISSE
ncbi:hypothetical protein BC834DRAFT_969545 [Gloeopeniophorella convolvens]|nr:hypothetical protein BC834DRAFT_969545 [Gloeopeniophorella convolvens]